MYLLDAVASSDKNWFVLLTCQIKEYRIMLGKNTAEILRKPGGVIEEPAAEVRAI